MTAVTLHIGGREYRLACDDGQEEQLRRLADDVEERMQSLLFGMGENPGDTLALLMTALTMADEIAELKRENEELRLLASENVPLVDENKVREMEAAMAATLEEIAHRIEKIADQVEIR